MKIAKQVLFVIGLVGLLLWALFVTAAAQTSSPTCRILHRIPTQIMPNGLTVVIQAEGAPGPAWRITHSLPYTVIAEGQLVNGHMETVVDLEWDRTYTLYIQASPTTQYSSPACQFHYQKFVQMEDDYVTMTEGETREFNYLANDTIPYTITGGSLDDPNGFADLFSPGMIRITNPDAGEYQIRYRVYWTDDDGSQRFGEAIIYLDVQPREKSADVDPEIVLPRAWKAGVPGVAYFGHRNVGPDIATVTTTVDIPDVGVLQIGPETIGPNGNFFSKQVWLTFPHAGMVTITATTTSNLSDPNPANNMETVTVFVEQELYLPFVER